MTVDRIRTAVNGFALQKLVVATQRKSPAFFMSSVCGVFNDLASRRCYVKFEGSFLRLKFYLRQ